MSLCIFHQDGALRVQRKRPAGPEPVRKALAPDRDQSVVAVAGLFTWDWRADLWARDGMPFVLGHALSLHALHGGKAKHATIDAQTMAVFRRGGLLPQASVSPADLRASRARLRRRRPLLRKRAARLAPIHKTPRPYPWPAMGTPIAYNAHRDGVAERFPAPAVPKRLAVDRARMGHDDARRRARALSRLTTAQQDDAHPRSRRRTVPGLGEILSLGLR